ncbi:hypothetical protein Bbelb_082480 [Branchiostoma belcheri]|nr:hypothetical protein Bbelb_082480 [Branchiostoma belcheri]
MIPGAVHRKSCEKRGVDPKFDLTKRPSNNYWLHFKKRHDIVLRKPDPLDRAHQSSREVTQYPVFADLKGVAEVDAYILLLSFNRRDNISLRVQAKMSGGQARSRASIAEQLLYSDCQLQRSDLLSLSETVQYKDIQVTDCMRCFIGNGPAQWVEAGEQHMGTYGSSAGCGAPMSRFVDLGFCFRRKVKSLEERRQVVVSLPSSASENNKGVCQLSTTLQATNQYLNKS